MQSNGRNLNWLAWLVVAGWVAGSCVLAVGALGWRFIAVCFAAMAAVSVGAWAVSYLMKSFVEFRSQQYEAYLKAISSGGLTIPGDKPPTAKVVQNPIPLVTPAFGHEPKDSNG